MKKPVLVIMAAGMGSRYGGLKQIDPVVKEGHIIMDFSIFDAKRAGFEKVVFIIKKEDEADFKEAVGNRMEKIMDVAYAYQDLHNLPEGFEVPEGRVKPWGTAHAVLSAIDEVDGPFAVINADDYYGKHAFEAIYNYLSEHEDDDKYRYAMVGYLLKNTVTDNGHVARGICTTNEEGELVNITERTRIEKRDGKIAFTENDGETWENLPEDTLVSMNMWGFTRSILDELKAEFPQFLKKGLTENPMKCEYFLPAVVSNLLEADRATAAVLPSADKWYGVTYKEDKPVVVEAIRNLKKEGYGIIIITHRMSEIMAISDKVTILRDGRQVADLVTADTNPEELSAYMIGRELNDDYHIEGSPKKDIMLELKNVSNHHRKHSRHKLENISLTIHKGEILGIAGVEGNGQKELAEVITGIQKTGEGEILLDGQNLAGINIRGRYEAGVSYISEERLSDSLITGMNISENLVLREYGKPPFANHSIINKAAIRKNAAEKMKQYQVRASGKSGIDTLVKLLSGGNQQKLIIARELNDHAKVIVASQPTRGLDIGATEFVRQQLIDQRNAGKGVMLISADLEEIMALSDRIAVLFGGKIVGILNREEATVQKIGLLMGGISEEEAR